MVQKIMEAFFVAVIAVVLIPIVDSLATAANVTGTARTIILLFSVFLALGALFLILRTILHSSGKKLY